MQQSLLTKHLHTLHGEIPSMVLLSLVNVKSPVRNPNFPRHYKATPISPVFSRRHAATVTSQCKIELDVQSALLVMHFLIFFSKFH